MWFLKSKGKKIAALKEKAEAIQQLLDDAQRKADEKKRTLKGPLYSKGKGGQVYANIEKNIAEKEAEVEKHTQDLEKIKLKIEILKQKK